MATVYTDGAGNYYQLGNINAQDPTKTDVGVTGVGQGRGTVAMTTADIPEEGWEIAPNLTDIGGGVWVNGALVDPTTS